MEKKLPKRMCLACRKMLAKHELHRIVCDKDDRIFFDETKKADGRGAYICNSQECLKKCIKSKLLSRTFKRNVANEIYDELSRLQD